MSGRECHARLLLAEGYLRRYCSQNGVNRHKAKEMCFIIYRVFGIPDLCTVERKDRDSYLHSESKWGEITPDVFADLVRKGNEMVQKYFLILDNGRLKNKRSPESLELSNQSAEEATVLGNSMLKILSEPNGSNYDQTL